MALRPSVTGVGGSAPPPGAPVTTVTGADTPTNVQFDNLNPDTLEALADKGDGRGGINPDLIGLDAQQMARVNERELAPLAPVPAGAPPIVKTAVVAAGAVQAASVAPAPQAPPHQMDAAARQHKGRLRPAAMQTAPQIAAPGVVAATDKPSAQIRPGTAAHLPAAAPGVVAAGPVPDQSRPSQASRADQPFQPAASNTDSPSRGIPRAIADPGKVITGGFGVQADAQYFPLDGSELLSLVYTLMDELAERLRNDLRFGMAICYPRVSARVQVVIEGYTVDQPITIERVMPSHEKTPIEIAAARADDICFIVKAQRREFDDQGQSETPPNAMRDQIGAVIPRKQAFGEGPQRVIADISS